MTSSSELIERFVRKRRAALEDRSTTSSRLRVILGECGWARRGARNLMLIQQALDQAGIFTQPRLSRRLRLSDRVYMSLQPIDDRCLFPTEEDLEEFLVSNFARIPAFDGLKSPQAQFKPPASSRRIDILARDRGDDAYVVIELKRASGDVVDDMTHYLKAVDHGCAKGRHPVRGVVITGAPDPVLAAAYPSIAGYPVSWHTYRVRFTLEEPNA